MDRFAALTGRQYKPFQYLGDPKAERVIILMGSGCETAAETVDYLNARGGEGRRAQGPAVPAVSMRRRFVEALPATVKAVAVLDRTKEPGALGEPLYLDVIAALTKAWPAGQGALKTMPKVLGGRYGLSSKDFTPAMVKAVFDNLAAASPKNHFTVGIKDDVSQLQPRLRPGFFDRVGQGGSRDVLRPRLRRHRWRQQELDQNHRRKHRQLRPGLFRL